MQKYSEIKIDFNLNFKNILNLFVKKQFKKPMLCLDLDQQ